MSEWKEDALHHKYDPLPDEPRHKKKRKRCHVRSDHKHEYEKVCVDTHNYVLSRKGRFPIYLIAKRCKICGRVGDWLMVRDVHEPPKGMRLFEAEDYLELALAKEIPDWMEVRE